MGPLGSPVPPERSPDLAYRSRAGRWVIVATVLGSAMASIDGTVVGIALPTIGREFHAPLVSMQWVVTGYLVPLAALLLLGGTLGDRFGRRRVFCIGAVWFAAASAACAAAPTAAVLIGTRILQGAGAALLVPESLAIIQASFVQKDRARAIGTWSGLSGVATAAGPLLGGYLIGAVSWRWIFLINIPVGIVSILLAVRHVPETRQPPSATRFDVAGSAMTVVFLATLTYGLVEGPSLGWTSGAVIGTLVAGVGAFAAFVVIEAKIPSPAIPLGIFRRRQFTVTNAVTFVVYAALGGALFLLPTELQVVDRYSALASGAALLPLTIVMLAFSEQSGRLAAKIGPRLQMSVGPVVAGVGIALLARSATDSSYVSGVLPAVLVFAVGLAITVAPLTATALGSISEGHAGLVSAVNNDVSRIGGLLAVAVLPALAGIRGQDYLRPSALGSGFRVAVLVAGACCASGGLLAAWGIQNPCGEQARAAARAEGAERPHCALDAAPLGASWER